MSERRIITKREMDNLARIVTATGAIGEIVKPDGTVFRLNPAVPKAEKIEVDDKRRRHL